MSRSRLKTVVAMLAAVLSRATLLEAQAIVPLEAPDLGRRQVVPFLEGTKVFLNVPRSDIKFEADIQPHLVVSQNFSDKLIIEETLAASGQSPTWRVAYSLVGTRGCDYGCSTRGRLPFERRHTCPKAR